MQNKTTNKALGVWVIFILAVIAIASMIISKLLLSVGPRVNHGSQGKSSSNVRSILQAIWIYSSNHNDVFPSEDQFPEALLELGYIDDDQLVSPVEIDDPISYIYVPGPSGFNAKRILIYEDPTHWNDFVIVGFADAHVEKLDHATFNRMLAEQMQD